jgi:hypothetical protein
LLIRLIPVIAFNASSHKSSKNDTGARFHQTRVSNNYSTMQARAGLYPNRPSTEEACVYRRGKAQREWYSYEQGRSISEQKKHIQPAHYRDFVMRQGAM